MALSTLQQKRIVKPPGPFFVEVVTVANRSQQGPNNKTITLQGLATTLTLAATSGVERKQVYAGVRLLKGSDVLATLYGYFDGSNLSKNINVPLLGDNSEVLEARAWGVIVTTVRAGCVIQPGRPD